MKIYLAEFFGTMFLVLLACGSAVLAGPSIGGLGIGLCFGLVLVCLCYAIGNVSGCHVNPAVSFAMLVSGKMTCKDFAGYVVAQLAGAAVGGALLYWFTQTGSGFNFGGVTGSNALATNVLQPGATSGMALLAEVLLTMFFVFIILAATDEKKGFGNFAGLAIGLGLGLVNIVGIPVDNCSVNPARSFGPALFSPDAWGDFWIMVVGPLVGAALAVILYKLAVNCNCKKTED
ncbi:MAG: aquaporin [Firmicutes bacterium]|nr:aquaporin [Bacillota bacterium]MCM1401045.1 aquaporin [Bacteroides sp.]MCM1476964.1 aquaporin [Bacteroides sp.]